MHNPNVQGWIADSCASPPPRFSPNFRTAAAWCGIAVLLVFEYCLFSQFVTRELAGTLPGYHDQSVYLNQSYCYYQTILTEGLWRGLRQGWQETSGNGSLLPIQGAVLYLFLGTTRLAALTLNFAYFAMFQVVLAATLRWYSGRWSAAFLGIGLTLSATSTFMGAGGMIDFRMDFIVSCLFGIFLCAVIRSELFRLPRWSAAAGALAGYLILFRFLTAVLLVGILGLVFAAFCVCLVLARQSPERRSSWAHRLRGLLLSGAVTSAVVVPALISKWRSILAYYLPQFSNGESQFRRAEAGYDDIATRLLYYPRSLYHDHVGTVFVELAAVALGVSLLLGASWLRRRNTPIPAASGLAQFRQSPSSLLFAACCIVLPLVVLTCFGVPSPVVGGITVTPLTIAVVLGSLQLLRTPGAPMSRTQAYGCTALATIALLVGTFMQANSFGRRLLSPAEREQHQRIFKMYDVLTEHAQRMHWKAPTVVHTFVSGVVYPVHGITSAFEKRGVHQEIRELLARTIGPMSESDARDAIVNSDFVVLQSGTARLPPYPFNVSLGEVMPALKAVCERTHVVLHRFRLDEDEVTLYVRPAPEVRGATVDGWIAGDSVIVSATAAELRDRPRIELGGDVGRKGVERAPAVVAEVLAPGSPPGSPPRKAKATIRLRGSRYEIAVDLNRDEIPDLPEVDIRLRFDSTWSPSEVYGNADTRRLGLRAPDVAKLLRDSGEP